MSIVVGDDGVARCPWAAQDPLLRDYHDTEWGVVVHGERELLERICLEGFQAGLSWRTILAKRPTFREAFRGFDPDAVAAFTAADVDRLLGDPGIVRNRRKIEAARVNARAAVRVRDDGGLDRLVWSFAPAAGPPPRSGADLPTSSDASAALSRELKRRGFVLVGPTTMFALMEAVGMIDHHLQGCHRRGCSAPVGNPG